MKKLIIIRNGRGIIAEGNDTDELQAAFQKAVDGHREGDPITKRDFPAFAAIKKCDHESTTGMLCILDTSESPNASKSYYNVGFVD